MRAPERLWKHVLQVLLLQVLPRAARRPAALCSAIRTTLRPLVVVHEAGNPGGRGGVLQLAADDAKESEADAPVRRE